MQTIPSELVEAVRTARSVVCFTGAGVSAESGVPTFRGTEEGLWQNYRPDELATPEGFQRNPRLVWDWYAWRREQVAKAQPNPGHMALVAFHRLFSKVTIVTQNIDGLHQRAGSNRVLELHGNLTRIKCSLDHQIVNNWEELQGSPPKCRECGGYLRPDVVWFGEPLQADILDQALRASRACDLFLSIGTSSLVYPAATLPYEALTAGAVLLEINPQPTPLSGDAHYVLRGPSGELLPQLVQYLSPVTPPGSV